jgi:hypothetical protein
MEDEVAIALCEAQQDSRPWASLTTDEQSSYRAMASNVISSLARQGVIVLSTEA